MASTPAPSADPASRSAARWAGILIILPFFLYAGGDSWMGSLRAEPDFLTTLPARRTELTLAALLLLINSIDVVVLAAVLHPLLTRYSPRMGMTYMAARIAEGLLLGAGALALLLVGSIAQEASQQPDPSPASSALYPLLARLAVRANFLCFQTGMLVLGLASVPLCALLRRARLLPGWLAGWGAAGYALLAAGCVLELFGVEVGVALSVPGGLWELAFGVWLIARGWPREAAAGAREDANGKAAHQE